MLLIEGSQCIRGEEPDVELALREALANAVAHGNEKGQIKVHIRCRCGAGNEIAIVVADQGFDFRNITGDGGPLGPAGGYKQGIQLMKAYMDEVYFERGGSEVHMRKRRRNRLH